MSLLGKIARALGRLLGLVETAKTVADTVAGTAEEDCPPASSVTSPRAITPRPPPIPKR